jgi:SMI1-KNR4 cell-wall
MNLTGAGFAWHEALAGIPGSLSSSLDHAGRMDLSTFQSFVRANIDWFRGVNPESPASFDRAQSQLGCLLPDSLKWLLTEFGYSGACGVSSLDEAVIDTLRFRTAIPLPQPYVILNDWGDAGVVCLDSCNGAVVWTLAHELPRFAAGQELGDADTFEDFPAWVVSRLEAARTEA